MRAVGLCDADRRENDQWADREHVLAIAAFEDAGLRSLVLDAMRAAESRAFELSKELGAE